MAIIEVGEAPNSAQINITPDQIKLTRFYVVVSDDINDSVYDVLNSQDMGLPDFFGSDVEYNFAVAKVFNAQRQIGNSCAWTVKVEFESPTQNDQNADPTQDIPMISIATESYQVAAQDVGNADGTGVPITNSFGDPYEPQPTTDNARTIITFLRHEDATTDVADLIDSYQDAINRGEFFGFPQHQVKCQSIRQESGPKVRVMLDGSIISYITIQYVFVRDPNGWDLVLLDQGFNFYKSAEGGFPGGPVAFKGADGVPKIGLLDGFGGDASVDPDTNVSIPVFLDPKEIYLDADFGELNLPNSMTDCIVQT